MAERKTIKEIKELLKNGKGGLEVEVQGIALGPILKKDMFCEFYIQDPTGLLYALILLAAFFIFSSYI